MYRRAILGLGYLPQETSIFRGLTVEENIMAVLEVAEPDKDARRDRLEQLLERIRPDRACATRRRWRCRAASGGAARSRARSPPSPSIMLLDEPFAGIDPISIADIRDLVRELKKRDIGVLITDHNVRETLDIVDRACIIYDGQVLFAGYSRSVGRRPGGPAPLPRRELRAVATAAMGLGPSLSIRQSQQLVLTPQLHAGDQAAAAVSNLELEAFIAEELSKNPLLEARAEDDGEQPAPRRRQR